MRKISFSFLVFLVALPARGIDEPPTALGDCNGDLRLDIGDAVFLLNYLFLGGESPSCPERCDFQIDGRNDIADAIALLGYLVGGTGPADPPVMEEECDGLDNDCDGKVDEGCPTPGETYSVDLVWDPVDSDILGNPERVAGYRVHHGTAPSTYTGSFEARGCACGTLGGLEPGVVYFVAVTAFDGAGNESSFSREIEISR